MKVEPLHFIQAAPRVVLSTIYGNFANNETCIFSLLIAQGHAKRWLIRGHNRFINCYVSPTVSSVYFHTNETDIKRQRKILASWFRGVMASSASFLVRYWQTLRVYSLKFVKLHKIWECAWSLSFAHEVFQKVFLFYFVAVIRTTSLLGGQSRYVLVGLFWSILLNRQLNEEARNDAHVASTGVRLY